MCHDIHIWSVIMLYCLFYASLFSAAQNQTFSSLRHGVHSAVYVTCWFFIPKNIHRICQLRWCISIFVLFHFFVVAKKREKYGAQSVMEFFCVCVVSVGLALKNCSIIRNSCGKPKTCRTSIGISIYGWPLILFVLSTFTQKQYENIFGSSKNTASGMN